MYGKCGGSLYVPSNSEPEYESTEPITPDESEGNLSRHGDGIDSENRFKISVNATVPIHAHDSTINPSIRRPPNFNPTSEVPLVPTIMLGTSSSNLSHGDDTLTSTSAPPNE
jgi:hypothetical protein